MKHIIRASLAALCTSLMLSALPAAAQQPAPAASEDARLMAFLDGEFAVWVKSQPQLATRLGIKAGADHTPSA